MNAINGGEIIEQYPDAESWEAAMKTRKDGQP